MAYSLIKNLYTGAPRGMPLGMDDLERLGVSPQAAARQARDGWLKRLGHGVYMLPGDEPDVHSAVKFLQGRVAGLHVGGRSALHRHGVRHTLAFRERVVLWGDARFTIPSWFSERWMVRYVSAQLFEWPAAGLRERTENTPPGYPEGLLISSPERAALELLYDVGLGESFEEARNIFDGLRNLRKDVIGGLLSCCTSVKTVRLFLTWSRETELIDVDTLREQYPLRVGSEKRWIGQLPDGQRLTLKPYG